MRRVDKENIKLFARLGVIESFNDLRERDIKTIMCEFDECAAMPFYVNGSEKIRAIVRVYYGMALKHSYGRLQASKVR